MPESTVAPGPAPSPHRGRAGRVAWRIGWVLLAAVSMCVTYAALVFIGR
ncbi:MAG: hypothetical protein ABR926_04035 [Streptosporangiaceae bacterium]|jgi:hypothetical protein